MTTRRSFLRPESLSRKGGSEAPKRRMGVVWRDTLWASERGQEVVWVSSKYQHNYRVVVERDLLSPISTTYLCLILNHSMLTTMTALPTPNYIWPSQLYSVISHSNSS